MGVFPPTVVGSYGALLQKITRRDPGQALSADVSDPLGLRYRSPLAKPRFVPGRYYAPPGTRVAATPPLDKLCVAPFLVGRKATFDWIGLEVTTGITNGKVRLGIYADDDDNYPSNLLLDAGQVDASTNASVGISILRELPVGLYWLAAVPQGVAPEVAAFSNASTAMVPEINGGSTDATGAAHTSIVTSASYSGALPDPFPAGQAAGQGIRVSLRCA